MGARTKRRAEALANIAGAREAARRALPRVLFDFVDGGALDEVTLTDNSAAFDEVLLRPRAADIPAEADLSCTVLGAELAMPVIAGPCGGVRLVSPDGDRALAGAAAAAGTAFVMSTASATRIEEVAAAAKGPHWFQLYFQGGRRGAEALVEQVAAAAFGALFVTVDVDTAGASNHERLFRHRKAFPLQASAANAWHFLPQLLARPRWTAGFIGDGLPTAYASVPEEVGDDDAEVPRSGSSMGKGKPKAAPQWSDIDWIRSRFTGPLVVKGVLSGADARLAREHGADGVVVSNHGGRQLDHAPATLRVLEEVRAAVGGDLEILLDGGVRRGGDVAKALALGADAVLIGRPYLYGLAAAGEDGAARVFEILATELSRSLRHLGCRSLKELSAESVDASGLRRSPGPAS